MKELTLEDLVGQHVLDAVDFLSVNATDQDSSAMRFRLDGVVYMVVEDPDDGYRSSMREIFVDPAPIVNVFRPIKVFGIYDSGTLRLKASGNGKTILEVGTDHSDSYYPSFVTSFNPEGIDVDG